MAEHITKSELKRTIRNHFNSNSLLGLLSMIDAMPAADVAPVRHGEWLLRHIGAGHYWECSACHTNPCIYVTEHTKFCPNCGARMDGETDGSD